MDATTSAFFTLCAGALQFLAALAFSSPVGHALASGSRQRTKRWAALSLFACASLQAGLCANLLIRISDTPFATPIAPMWI